MTANAFRRLALGLRAVVESAHHGHPDFRVGGRIFATLGYPDRTFGMVLLTPEQQRTRVREHPEAFAPASGKWGEQGATIVRLAAIEEEMLGEALTLAWQNKVGGSTAPSGQRTRRAATRASKARKKI